MGEARLPRPPWFGVFTAWRPGLASGHPDHRHSVRWIRIRRDGRRNHVLCRGRCPGWMPSMPPRACHCRSSEVERPPRRQRTGGIEGLPSMIFRSHRNICGHPFPIVRWEGPETPRSTSRGSCARGLLLEVDPTGRIMAGSRNPSRCSAAPRPPRVAGRTPAEGPTRTPGPVSRRSRPATSRPVSATVRRS